MTRTDDGRIDFEALPNTRDLGGLPAAGGRHIRFRRLLRSGALGLGSDADIIRLRDDYDLRAIADFRNGEELSELPDPVSSFPRAIYLHLPVLGEVVAGIAQSKDARERLAWMARIERDPASLMEEVYPHILLDERGRTGYAAFLRLALEADEGSLLWHCSMGRDRAGMATVLVQHVLGVPMELIERDYLATNRYARADISEKTAANPRFLHAALSALESEVDGLEGYERDVLGLEDADIRELRDRWLEA